MTVRRGDPCTIEDCGKSTVGRGWCSKHYAIWRKYGDPLHPTRRYVKQAETCSVEVCGRKPDYHGMCYRCLRRIRSHGEATDPRERRFWANVDRRGNDECWPWAGYCQPNGYGSFSNHKPGQTRLAHRIAYEYLVGAIPKGLVLDHLCHTRDPNCADNDQCVHRRCCNPAHLDPCTRRENIERGRGGDSWGYVPERIPVKPKAPKPTSCTNGCDRPIYKSSICRPCYRKWLKDPNVVRPSTMTREDRFWAKVDRGGPIPEHRPELGQCWVWTASINGGTGYGQFSLQHGKMQDAHRFSYELANGPIPPGLDVHHECHRRDCVRPEHLTALTRSQNLALRKVRRS